jgi:hypothetical protein
MQNISFSDVGMWPLHMTLVSKQNIAEGCCVCLLGGNVRGVTVKKRSQHMAGDFIHPLSQTLKYVLLQDSGMCAGSLWPVTKLLLCYTSQHIFLRLGEFL